MNNPNPNQPQSPLLDQKVKSRSRLKVAVFTVLAINVVPLMLALLMQGCKREQPAEETNNTTTETNPPAIMDTNPPPMVSTSAAPVVAMPPEPVAPPAPPAPTTTEYVVVKNDSFYSIGKKFGVTMKAISEANPGVDSTKLKIGQKLTIPAGSGTSAAAGSAAATAADMSSGEITYTVKSGDTLTKIAKENGTTYKAIKAANNLTTDKIKVGEKLKIPVKEAPAAPAPAPEPPPMSTPAPAPATTPAPAPAPANGQ